MSQPTVKFLKIAPGAQIPKYQTPGAAGMDLCSVVRKTIGPGGREVISTGLRIKIAEGFEGQVRPRSGLAAKHGITVLNTPGTIDSDYTGELKVILQNNGKEVYTVICPDRIAQLVISPVVQAEVKEISEEDELGETERGSGGLGSTGK